MNITQGTRCSADRALVVLQHQPTEFEGTTYHDNFTVSPGGSIYKYGKAVNEKPETDPDWEERKAKRQRFETPPVASPPSPRGSVASLEVDDDEVL